MSAKARRKVPPWRSKEAEIMFSHVMLGCSDREQSKKFYDATLGALGHQARAGFRQVRLVDDPRRFARRRTATERRAHAATAMARPSASRQRARSRSTPGTQPASPMAAHPVKTRRACATAASARCTSPICATRTATSSAASTGLQPTSEHGGRQRKPLAWRAAARREACVVGDRHRHDLLDLPAATGR